MEEELLKGVSLSFGKLCHPTAVLSVNREKKNWASADNAVRKASPCLSQPVGAMAKTEPEAAKISAQEYNLCRNHNCSVGYYAVGVQLEKGELRVPVNFKERNYQGPVCYCFNHTVKSIRTEMKIKGHSTARSAITQEIKPVDVPARSKIRPAAAASAM